MDLVQYRLQLLDQRNEGLRGLLHRGLECTPLGFCAVGLMSGIAAERYAQPGVTVWLVMLGAVAAIGIPLCLLLKPERRPAMAALAAMLAFLSLGGIRFQNATEIDPSDISSLILEDGSIADLRGRVTGNTHIEDRSRWQFGQFVRSDPTSGFDMEVRQARCVDGWRDVTGTVRVVVGEPVYGLRVGDGVQVYAYVSRFRDAMNPGGFDAKSFYGAMGMSGAAFVESRAAIEPWLASEPQGAAARFQQWLRSAADRKLRWGRPEMDESDGLLQAFLLGTRSDIGPGTYEAFRRTGLLHYVSLSGMNIAIVMAAVWQFARVVGITRRKRAAICIVGIVLFVILVPAQSPILRAGIIGIVFCAAAILRRQTEPVNTLALAAILILLVSPGELFSVGWQLSFGCVLGILLFTRRLEFLFYNTISTLLRRNFSSENMGGGIAGGFLRGTVTLLATGLGAWLGGGGFMLYHFYNITPLATLWTAITSPLMTAITIVGYVKMILSGLLPTAGTLLAPVTSFLSWAFIWAVTLMAKVGISEIVIGHVPVWLIAAFYAAIIYVPLVHWPAPRLKGVIGLLLTATFVIGLAGTKWQRANPQDAELTVLSVGHGQTAVARLPGGSFAFDCGSLTIKDCGRRVVLPYLRWQGTGQLDGAFLSHSDIDHCNGIGEILPGDVFVSPFTKVELAGGGKDAILRRAVGDRCRQAAAGQTIVVGRAKITTLWPPEEVASGKADDNDKSLVSLIEFGGRRILLSSDIQQFAQREMLALYPDLKADVVIAPHHGSPRSLEKGFYERLEPEAIVFSCDGTQQKRVLKATAPLPHVRTFFTSSDGAVTIRIGADGQMSFETFVKAQ
jgi:competence protein ComEC